MLALCFLCSRAALLTFAQLCVCAREWRALQTDAAASLPRCTLSAKSMVTKFCPVLRVNVTLFLTHSASATLQTPQTVPSPSGHGRPFRPSLSWPNCRRQAILSRPPFAPTGRRPATSGGQIYSAPERVCGANSIINMVIIAAAPRWPLSGASWRGLAQAGLAAARWPVK